MASHLLWLIVLCIACSTGQAGVNIAPKPALIEQAWGDQGDGTYVNPVIPADYSDLDAIRVGDDFYAISSTFQLSPGVVILRSKDLVNWTILGHAVNDLTKIGPEMNWDRMDRYGRGIWAGSIRTIFYDEKGKLTPGPAVAGIDLYIRSTWGFDGQSQYAFSINGSLFLPFGNKWNLTWGHYRGDRIGIFCFNNKSDTGYVDVDWFHHDVARSSAQSLPK